MIWPVQLSLTVNTTRYHKKDTPKVPTHSRLRIHNKYLLRLSAQRSQRDSKVTSWNVCLAIFVKIWWFFIRFNRQYCHELIWQKISWSRLRKITFSEISRESNEFKKRTDSFQKCFVKSSLVIHTKISSKMCLAPINRLNIRGFTVS